MQENETPNTTALLTPAIQDELDSFEDNGQANLHKDVQSEHHVSLHDCY